MLTQSYLASRGIYVAGLGNRSPCPMQKTTQGKPWFLIECMAVQDCPPWDHMSFTLYISKGRSQPLKQILQRISNSRMKPRSLSKISMSSVKTTIAIPEVGAIHTK